MFNTIVQNIVMYIILDIILMIQMNIFDVYKTKFIKNFNLKLRTSVLEKCNSLSLCDFENSKIYDMIQRSEEEGINKMVNFIDNFIQLLKILVNLVSYLFILILFKIWIIIPIIIFPCIKYYLTQRYNLKEFEIVNGRTNKSRRVWYLNYILTKDTFFKEIKLNNLGTFFINKYEEIYNQFNLQDIRLISKYYLFLTIVSIGEQIIDGVIFIYIIYCGYIKEILIGNVITYTNSLMKIKDNIQDILDIIAKIKQDTLYIDLFYDFLSYESNEISGEVKITSIKTIEIKNLSFKYNKNSNYVLRNINLKLESNKLYTILGINGSGKTTLTKIIMGFYSNYEGTILVNGINLKVINKDNYRSLIGSLFQDFVKFESSYYENIAYGNVKKIQDYDYIKNIAEKFSIDKILKKNGDNINSQIGYWFDDGRQISIGQWQKIALARAFAKDADMYILDEPNASLDVITEREIEDMYLKMFENRIGIIVAHRFNNIIKRSSTIIILNKGEILEQGKHDDLILNCDLYKDMFFSNLNNSIISH